MSTSQVLQHLYSFDTSSPNLPRYLYILIQCDEEEQYLSGLQGLELDRLVDFLDEALDAIPTTGDVYRQCLHKLQTICGHHMTLPSSHNVSGDLTKVGDYPISVDGGTADVWEGTHGGRTVCIKCPRVSEEDLQSVTRSFLKEAVIWKRLRHSNIVPFIGVTRDPLQFVSEYLPNGTLTKYVKKNPSADRITLLLDVAEGLNYLHTNHTIHGDLKGPNILVDRDGSARLTDFGLTSVIRGLGSSLVTKVKGYTEAWAAPEVLREGDKATPEADIFSFGMVVIEAFTGMYPFSGFTNPIIILKITNGERPTRPMDVYDLGLTDLVWDMTLRCWAQYPAHRPMVTEVVGILRECKRLRTLNPPLSDLAPSVIQQCSGGVSSSLSSVFNSSRKTLPVSCPPSVHIASKSGTHQENHFLESGEVLESNSPPTPIPGTEIPQPPVSRVRRNLSRMSLSALAAINSQTEAGGNRSIEPYSFEPSFPSATTEKPRLNQSDPPASTGNMPPSLQRGGPPSPSPTLPPVRASSPLMTNSFPSLSYAPPPTPSMIMAASTSNLIPTRPAGLIDPRQTQAPLISPVAMRLGARQRVKSTSVPTGPPSSIIFPRVDPRETANSKSSPPVSPLEPPTPTWHHYPGRPLPTPPVGVPPSPSAYESLLLPQSAKTTRFALTLNAANGVGSTTMTERGTVTASGLSCLTDRLFSPISIASGSSIAEVIKEVDGDTLGRGVADPDPLISRIDSNDGGTYQDLPTVSEAIREVERPGTARPHDRPEDSAGIPLVGGIEVQSRRRLKDGRVKLKVRLMGVSVNNCGICFMQFKDKEMGALTPKCQHPYHEYCLKMWLQRIPTCPLCRSPLKQL